MNEKMRELTEALPFQLVKAFQIAESSKLNKKNNIKNIVISGLGGSGIGATIVSNWIAESCPVPIVVNKGYFAPNFVDENTLVICCSYSGNTEETTQVMKSAFDSKAQMICISSGGEMIDFCKTNQIDYIQVDGGMPPRTCVGYSIVSLLYALTFNGMCDVNLINQLKSVSPFLIQEKSNISDISKQLATILKDKLPILYGDEKNEGVIVRYRQQINENSKMLCWHHVIPEMNHNEMVGWHDKHELYAVLFINTDFDYIRNVQRRKINEETIKNYTSDIHNIQGKGANVIEQSMYLIYLCDILSIDLADLRGVDAMDIEVINHLKSSLAQLNF